WTSRRHTSGCSAHPWATVASHCSVGERNDRAKPSIGNPQREEVTLRQECITRGNSCEERSGRICGFGRGFLSLLLPVVRFLTSGYAAARGTVDTSVANVTSTFP